MSIISSSHVLGLVQADGRRYVTEDHVDNIGRHLLIEYLAAAGADYVAIRTARAARLAQMLLDRELVGALATDADPVLQYATKTDLAAALRAAYLASAGDGCSRLAAWVLGRIESGYVTDAQVRGAFGLSAGQWTTLKAKMTTLRTNYNVVLAAQGE